MKAALELVFANPHHAPTDAGLLKTIMLALPNERVTLAAPSEHQAAVTEILGADATALGRLDVKAMPPGRVRPVCTVMSSTFNNVVIRDIDVGSGIR